MASLLQFVTSRIDPLQFFSASSSNPSIAPYSIPSSSSTHSEFGDGDTSDLASFALRNYVLAVLTSPLQVVETLSEEQYQKREESTEQNPAPTTAQEAPPKTEDHLPPLQDGVWENIREIVESDGEGWTSLLKGHFTNFAFHASHAILQPALEEAINDAFDVYEDTHPATLVLSHVAVGGLLSPLELVRTRLIVQPSQSHRKKYYGPLHALHAVATEEGRGFSSLYSARHLVPSIIVHGLSPVLRIISKTIITDELGLDPTFTPVLHHLATLAFMAIEVGIITPIDMARKRIQLQRLSPSPARSGPADAPQACETSVEVSPKYYSGIWNCIRSIVAEEGGKSKRRRRRRRHQSTGLASEWHQVHDHEAEYGLYDIPSHRRSNTGFVASVGRFASGVRTLYRGFWARYASRVVVYAFDEISQSEENW
ncbi:hypothetical protein SpCBS45565_g08415 [Spizellomyces sp. 'palustris']|nr:hypothetical protein SpCBS45565_g08415 [Spizellomyces sp. 'palustris']